MQDKDVLAQERWTPARGAKYEGTFAEVTPELWVTSGIQVLGGGGWAGLWQRAQLGDVPAPLWSMGRGPP